MITEELSLTTFMDVYIVPLDFLVIVHKYMILSRKTKRRNNEVYGQRAFYTLRR